MTRRHLLTTAVAAGLLAGACQEASAPNGTPGSVVVQVYIDRNGSASLDGGDILLAEFDVSLVLDGATIATQTTDSDGRASFVNVAPGRYRVVPGGSTPAGAVLSTNPEPTANIPYGGGTDTVAFRFSYFPGSVAGRLYRDDNSNGSYDAGIDTPGAGLYVLLGENGSVLDSVVTDANGQYRFDLVTPGSYTVQFEQTPTISYGGGATCGANVAPLATDVCDGVFTGSLVVSIASARARTLGAGVTVTGRLTVPPNVFTSGSGGVNSEIWVQDATGGIAIFSVPSASPLALGDSVEVSGTLGAFGGQLQIASGPTVTFKASASAPAPATLTVAQANARGANEGRLVSVSSVRIVSVPGGTGAAFTVIGEDAVTGEDLQIRVASLNTGLTRSSFVVGNEYIVKGILTQFNGTAQIKPRFATDVAGPISIATARATAIGQVVTVAGNITVPPNIFTSGSGGVNSEIWIQDASGGISVFSVPSASTLVLGDRIEVTGTVGAFGGQLQLTSPVVTLKAAGTAPAPVAVTGTAFNALANEGQLVTLPITITVIPTGTGGSFTVNGTAADGQAVQIRVGGFNTNITRASFVVGNTYTVTGVLTQFNGTAQVKPRFATDVTP